MQKALGRRFFNRPTLRVARELLGKYLVRRIGKRAARGAHRGRASPRGREIARKITEVEAYVGFSDRASHARRGMTPKNRVMFGPPGTWYVYFTYGMHWMLNVVTERAGFPAAVLIRGVENVSGPARVTKFLNIDKRLNARPVSRKAGLWVEDRGVQVPARAIRRGPRIGIDRAGAWKKRPWRFYL